MASEVRVRNWLLEICSDDWEERVGIQREFWVKGWHEDKESDSSA
jgi:hypothetical protein